MRTGPRIRLPASSYEERCAARERTMVKPQESIADFKHRIALLMRNKEGGKVYSIIGAARPDPCVVRPKKDERKVAHPKPDGILQP